MNTESTEQPIESQGKYEVVRMMASDRKVPESTQYQLLVSAYGGMWLILMIFFIAMWKKQNSLTERLAMLQEKIEDQ